MFLTDYDDRLLHMNTHFGNKNICDGNENIPSSSKCIHVNGNVFDCSMVIIKQFVLTLSC